MMFTSENYWLSAILYRKYCGIEIDTWSCGVILFALLAGYLPFDEEVIPALFKKIREADYQMPTHISPPAQDLIKRMLQPDPLKRIKFSMIKNHPWLRDSDTMYIEIGQRNTRVGFQNKIQEEVLNKLMKMDFNFHNLPPNKIREAILKKKYYSFVIGYDLMLNESIKAEIVATKSKLTLKFCDLIFI